MMIEVLGYSDLLFWAWNRSGSGDLNTPIVLLSATTLVIVVSMGAMAPILMPLAVLLAVYRIVEEALNNVLKHAAAKCVDVELTQTSDMKAELLIRDDGWGFDLDKQELGFGILTMQDYCGAVGGTLEVNSAPGSGTTVEALSPFRLMRLPPRGSPARGPGLQPRHAGEASQPDRKG